MVTRVLLALALFVLKADRDIAGGAGLIAALLAWLVLMADLRRHLWVVEKIIGQDLDGDGSIGKADPDVVEIDPKTVRLEIKSNGGKSMSYVDLPISDRKLRGVAHAILKQGKNLSRAGLSETLSQGEYKKLRDAMARRGLVVKRGNRTDITDKGRETLGMILGQS